MTESCPDGSCDTPEVSRLRQAQQLIQALSEQEHLATLAHQEGDDAEFLKQLRASRETYETFGAEFPLQEPTSNQGDNHNG